MKKAMMSANDANGEVQDISTQELFGRLSAELTDLAEMCLEVQGVIVNALKTMGIENVFDETDVDAVTPFMLRNPVHIVVTDSNMPEKTGWNCLGPSVRTSSFPKPDLF